MKASGLWEEVKIKGPGFGLKSGTFHFFSRSSIAMKGFAKVIAIFLLLGLTVLYYYGARPLNEHIYKYLKPNVSQTKPIPIKSNPIQLNFPTTRRQNVTTLSASESSIEKVNDLVMKYVTLPLDYGYGSGMIPLTIATLLSDGPILELGMGKFSTPLLHLIGTDQARQVVSLETDKEWMQKFAGYNSTQYHKIYYHSNFDSLSQYETNITWGMVLVDHIYGNRRPLHLIRFANLSKIVVAHDSEKRNEFEYQYERLDVAGHFKYRCKYSIYNSPQKNSYISTTIFSNFIELEPLGNLFKEIYTDYGHVACDDSMKWAKDFDENELLSLFIRKKVYNKGDGTCPVFVFQVLWLETNLSWCWASPLKNPKVLCLAFSRRRWDQLWGYMALTT